MGTKRKKFYITTAIDYVNGKPHIGHALEKIQADVLARFHRAKGEDVWFLTGTDEHGAKIARAAESEGKNPKEFVDEISQEFRKLKVALNLSWDDFIRTSDQERHWPGVQKLWRKLEEAGKLYKKRYRGLYCVGHEAFVTEKDLVNGLCRDHQKEPEVIEEENYFFKLSDYGVEIGKKIESGELAIIPESRKNEILSFINGGLEDVSFSRPANDLSWGVPVPDDPDHTMYVWCDALTNYISAIGYGRDEKNFDAWWGSDEVVHVIGKDILRFHAAIWPGMLLAAGIALPKKIIIHGFITVEGQKMSKTIGNVVDPVELVEKYGIDPVRYYLLREIPSGEDGDFSIKKFEERYNGDLANGLGNLVARVATLGERISPIEFQEEDIRFAVDMTMGRRAIYEKHIQAFHLNEALSTIWELISLTDKYIADDKPWTIKDDPDLFRRVMVKTSYFIHVIRELIEPFLPGTARKINEQISIEGNSIKIKRGNALFPRRMS